MLQLDAKPTAIAHPAKQGRKQFNRIETLDAWRGMCMVMVFTCHSLAATALLIQNQNPGLSFDLRKSGFLASLGLQYFFVFSGCLITRILLQAKDKPNYFRNYYMRRVLRIFPLYYAFLFACLVVGPAIFGKQRFLHDFLDIGLRPTCLWFYGTNIWQALKDNWCFGSLTHLWSLAVEEHFYLAWPFIVAALTPRRLLHVSVVLIAISTAFRLFEGFVLHDPIGVRVNTFCNMDCIAAGAIVAILLHTRSKEHCGALAKKLLIAGAVLLPIYIVFGLKFMWLTGMFVPSVAAVGFSGVIMQTLLDPNSCKLFGQRVLVQVGKYCYGLYVIHYPVIHFVSLYLVKASWPVPVLFGAIFMLSWMILIPIAMLSFHYLEMPFLKLKDRFEASDTDDKVSATTLDIRPAVRP